MTTKSSEEKRREEKRDIQKKRIEHMLTHFLYAAYMYHFFPLSLCVQGALTHATLYRGLTIKYKLESVEKRKEN
jgi:hypothetical protein